MEAEDLNGVCSQLSGLQSYACMVVEIAADHSCWNDENVTCAQVNLSKGEHMQAGGSENDDDDFGLGDVFPVSAGTCFAIDLKPISVDAGTNSATFAAK